MTTVDTTHLGTLFDDATEDLEPRAGFTDAVLRGGRKRRLRHRVAVATAATAAIAVVTGGTVAMVTDSGAAPTSVTVGWLSGPPKGPLGGDQPTIDQAIKVWEDGKAHSPNAQAGIFDDMRDAPHVYWAGTTAAGPAAVVMQQAYLHPHDNLPETAADTRQTLVGLVAEVDGRLTLVSDQFQWRQNDPVPGYFQFGAGDRTVLVVDPGQPLFQMEQGDRWERMPIENGVAIKQYPADKPPLPAVVVGTDPDADSAVQLKFLPASEYLGAAAAGGGTGPLTDLGGIGLNWPAEVLRIGLPGGAEFDESQTFYDAVSTKVGTVNPINGTNSDWYWYLRANLADGRVAVLGDIKWNPGTPARIYAVLVSADGSKDVLDGDVVNRHSPLPVKMRMPDGQGWVVANHGHQLSYRTDGDWVAAGKDAALLPDDATQVKVADKVVDLPR